MKILKMTATFGKLENETLVLQDGMNVLTLPNEAGKSTWSAFLLAMLYGIDTFERASKGVLPAKTRYMPWSGSFMSGVIELEHEGRRITIERKSTKRIPMGEFLAYDTQSGLQIPELTGENCGMQLLGVERSVFERSAFLSQNSAAVTSDAALEKRLAALVTTGEEENSYSDVEKHLKELKNKCRSSKSKGLLPEAENALCEVNDKLEAIRTLHKNSLLLESQKEALEKEKARLQTLKDAFSAEEARNKLKLKKQAQDTVLQAQSALTQAEEAVKKLPEEAVLQSLRQQLRDLAPQSTPQKPELPPPPAVFQGLTDRQAMEKAEKDGAEYDRLCAEKERPPLLFGFFACVGLIFAFLMLLLHVNLAAVIGGAIGAVFCILFLCRVTRNQQLRRNGDRANRLALAYGCERSEWLSLAVSYREQQLVYSEKLAQYEQQCKTERARAEQTARILGQVSMFSSHADSVEQAENGIEAALMQYQALRERKEKLESAQKHYEALAAAIGDAEAAELPVTDLTGYTAERVEAELHSAKRQLHDAEARLFKERGMVESVGDPAVLSAKRELLTQQVQELTQKSEALELAEQTLSAANEELQTRFAPKITALAGEILSSLTDTRYDALHLQTGLSVSARESQSELTRPILSLSSGTADQAYLALRLAICRLALAQDVPIVLDDALLRFDDRRLASALRLLAEEAKTRQVLLFTCQDRESRLLG